MAGSVKLSSHRKEQNFHLNWKRIAAIGNRLFMGFFSYLSLGATSCTTFSCFKSEHMDRPYLWTPQIYGYVLKFLDDVDKNLPQCSAKWCLRAGIIGTKGWNLLLRLYSLRDWGYANNFWVVEFHACQNLVFFLLNTDYFEWEWQFAHLWMLRI